MNWIQSVRHKYSLNLFHKRAKKGEFRHEFIDLDTAKKIGFVVNINMMAPKDLIALTDFLTKLEDSGKTVFVVEINFKRKSEPMFNETIRSIFINPDHINWLGFPSTEKLQEINKEKPEILMNLDTSEKMTSRFICGLSNADTRAGMYEEGYEEFYELMLDISKDTKLKDLLSHLETYLKMIEK